MKKWFSNLTQAKAAIMAACIVAIATMVGAYLQRPKDVETKELEIKTTQTAEAQLTELARMATDSSSPFDMLTTPSPMNAVIQTPTQLLALTPALLLTPSLETTRMPAASAVFTPTSIPVSSIPADTLFYECRDNTFGNASVIVNPNCGDSGRKGAIQLAWTVPYVDSFIGCTISLDSVSSMALRNKALILWARGAYNQEQILIKLKDDTHEQGKLIRLSTDWQQVVLVFLNDFPDINLGQLKKLTIGISYDATADSRNGTGSACFGDIGFGSP